MTKNEYIQAFRVTRLIIYLVLICLCVLFTYFKPFYYLCDYGEIRSRRHDEGDAVVRSGGERHVLKMSSEA